MASFQSSDYIVSGGQHLRHHSTTAVPSCHQINVITAAATTDRSVAETIHQVVDTQTLANIVEISHSLRTRMVPKTQRFIRREGVNRIVLLTKKAEPVDGGLGVESGDDGVLHAADGGVVSADEPVLRGRGQQRALRGVELQLCDRVAVGVAVGA